MNVIRVMYWEIKMDVLRTFRYRFGMVTDLAVFFVLFTIFMMTDTGMSYADTYGYSNYKGMLLLGYIAWMYASSAIADVSEYMNSELVSGTMYKKILSKYSLKILFFGLFISSVFLDTIIIIVMVFLQNVIFSIGLNIKLMHVLVIIISTVGMYGIGLVIAGLSIYFKRVGSVVFLTQTILLFVTDTVPTNNMVLNFSKIIPLTRCNELLKMVTVGKSSFDMFLGLIVCSAIWLALGIVIFNILMKQAKKKGNLLFY